MSSENANLVEGFTSGTWNGFYVEKHNENRGWMHLYMDFQEGKIKGEGTDYVGPWTLEGSFDEKPGIAVG